MYDCTCVDGFAAEHFIFADDKILTILSTSFNSFLTNGYIPSEFIKFLQFWKVKLVILLTNISNYRPIALVTAMSKIF